MNVSSKPEPSGVLKGHVQKGKLFQPALVAMGVLETTNWYRDGLPDLIWPVSVICDQTESGALSFSRLQQALITELGLSFIAQHQIVFDGSLSNLEEIPEIARSAVLEVVARTEFVDLIALGHAVLSLYENPPGWWLFEANGAAEDAAEALGETQGNLARAVGQVLADGHLNALVKAMRIGWLLGTEALLVPPESGQLLIEYPVNEETRAQADSFIRATYQTVLPDESEDKLARKTWARRFWNTNYENSGCLLESQDNEIFNEAPNKEGDPGVGTNWQQTASSLTGEVADAISAIYTAATQSPEIVDIYAPAKCEVVLGQLSRCSRMALRLFATPWMWTGEYSSGVIRTIVEAQIQIEWMAQQPTEDDRFEAFQEFGAGKRKLYRSLMAERIEKADDAGLEVPEGLRSAEAQFAESGGGRFQESLREVSLDTTFIKGMTLRAMAIEAGLDDLYRYIFQSSSGVVHGEWWAIEDYAMERCWNPLHRLHWVPCPIEASAPDAQAAANVRDQMIALCAIAESALGLSE